MRGQLLLSNFLRNRSQRKCAPCPHCLQLRQLVEYRVEYFFRFRQTVSLIFFFLFRNQL